MFGKLGDLRQYNKAFVPLILIVVYFIQKYTGFEINIGEAEAAVISGLFLSFIVYLVPNKLPDSTTIEIPTVTKVDVPNNVAERTVEVIRDSVPVILRQVRRK